ncbi:unnamed protein product [Hydatigera taeniaeformis]|uniref:Uncharacterized protein n=1 Tax=Hydatigena taeniaeformis TaxID=6205 RepID=A0A3P7GKF0_HYDTA|nr:unnamed protein product [Hydatigera taeniaeformis]
MASTMDYLVLPHFSGYLHSDTLLRSDKGGSMHNSHVYDRLAAHRQPIRRALEIVLQH